MSLIVSHIFKSLRFYYRKKNSKATERCTFTNNFPKLTQFFIFYQNLRRVVAALRAYAPNCVPPPPPRCNLSIKISPNWSRSHRIAVVAPLPSPALWVRASSQAPLRPCTRSTRPRGARANPATPHPAVLTRRTYQELARQLDPAHLITDWHTRTHEQRDCTDRPITLRKISTRRYQRGTRNALTHTRETVAAAAMADRSVHWRQCIGDTQLGHARMPIFGPNTPLTAAER
ncbi:hypothetical protein Zmor_012853 [Zophobas morio]|mgnify:FL=1|uniref:Uncharacterized protein n=1 Tax=Zophobas morio TaxID=2755281 RepID=A0AA38ICA4_9CUCU|nr:hypothetical protein Zmor_012853 [Zophobas morio]